MTDKITKEDYFNLDNEIVQDITQNFIQDHIYRNQSSLITHLQENFVEGFNFDDIENFYKKLFIRKEENDIKKIEYSNQISKKDPSYINVLKIINNYFNN